MKQLLESPEPKSALWRELLKIVAEGLMNIFAMWVSKKTRVGVPRS